MKLSQLLPLAAVSSAFIIPDEAVMKQVAIDTSNAAETLVDKLPSKETLIKEFENSFSHVADASKNAFDSAVEFFADAAETTSDRLKEEYFDVKAWLATGSDGEEGPRHPHHPPHHDKPPHGKHPHHGPHHGKHPHHKSNLTVYQLISESKYTTKLAKLISEDDSLVQLLNGTTANFTVFAPTDKAFEKIPEHGRKPSKEFIRKLLTYHISKEFYPAGRVLASNTIPTLLPGEFLSEDPVKTPQRLSIHIGFRGLTVNFYSRVVAINILGSNGVIHGVDSILIPPPKAAAIINFLPGEFSTLELALTKTGLDSVINDTSNHLGGTIFAPSNWAFKKLGPRINGFLFSRYGLKYLTALLKYHVVANQTLYSDAFYGASSSEAEKVAGGLFHVDLPTLLEDRNLSIDIAKWGRFVGIRINGYHEVSVADGIAKDGVIQVVSDVLIPPKKLNGELVHWQGEELTEDDLKERLEPFVKDSQTGHDLEL